MFQMHTYSGRLQFIGTQILKIGEGDDVLASTFTFIGSINTQFYTKKPIQFY